MENTDSLIAARNKIDNIDKKIAELFEERMLASRDVANYKKNHGLPIFDNSRENEVIRSNIKYVKNSDIQEYYVLFLKEAMRLSREYQKKLNDGMKIAHQGVEGAFSYIAAQRIFKGHDIVSFDDFQDAYKAVENGECDCVVLPIENSYAGEVGRVMDIIFAGSLYMNGIYELPVNHHLIGLPGASISKIKKVISHSQAINQCMPYITRKGFETEAYSNTAAAAKHLLERKDTTCAAIASEETAEMYGLEILERNINSDRTNTTRFGVFARSLHENNSKKGSSFSLMFTVKNEPGALGSAINVIGGNHGFNMRTLRSRPLKGLMWQYYFYIEADGDINSIEGERMLKELSFMCDNLKVIGTFTPGTTL